MTDTPLYFIQPHVIERLKTGQFVARRHQAKNYPLRDRRDVLSPMNVTRRAIAYEPLVFSNHKEDIQHCAEALNQPNIRSALITGPSGRGKTSFVRGLVEMVGGVDAYTGYTAQLLWFEVSRHTDSDEIIRFLVDYLTSVCETEKRLHNAPTSPFSDQKPSNQNSFKPLDGPSPFVQPETLPLVSGPLTPPPEEEDQIAALTVLLNNMARMPILIILDNAEHLTTPGLGFRSPELKEAIQFLLTFKNVKLVLAGRTVPSKDLGNQTYQYTVPALSARESFALIENDLTYVDPKMVQHLVPYFNGEPALLRVFANLFPYYPNAEEWQTLLGQHSPQEAMWQIMCKRLSTEEKNVFQLISLVRHGLTKHCLETIVHACIPLASDFEWKMLHGVWIKLLLKKVYPPQMVLTRLNKRDVNEQNDSHDSIDAYYQMQEMFHEPVSHAISTDALQQLHMQLHSFYLSEKDKNLSDRIYSVRTRHLAHEAQHHLSMAKKYERMQKQAPTAVEMITPEITGGTEYQLAPRTVAEPVTSESVSAVTPMMSEPMPTILGWDDQVSQIQMSPMPVVVPIQPVVQFAPAATSSQMQPIHLVQQQEFVQPIETYYTPQQQQQTEEILQAVQPASTQNDAPQETVAELPAYEKAFEIFNKGHEAFLRYQHNDALRLLHETLYLIESEGAIDSETKVLAQTYFDLGEIAAFREDQHAAISYYQKSLEYQPHDPAFQARSWFQIATAYENQNNKAQSLKAYHEAAEASAKSGYSSLMANACYNMARLYEEMKQPEKALEAIQQTLVLDQHLNNQIDLSRSLRVKARICQMLGKYDAAQQAAKSALNHIMQNGSLLEKIECQLVLAALYENVERWHDSLSWYHEAERIGQMVLSPKSLADIQESIKRVGALHNDTSRKRTIPASQQTLV